MGRRLTFSAASFAGLAANGEHGNNERRDGTEVKERLESDVCPENSLPNNNGESVRRFDVNPYISSEDDGTRTRNHRIDSCVVEFCPACEKRSKS
jgi:hypothetical protein